MIRKSAHKTLLTALLTGIWMAASQVTAQMPELEEAPMVAKGKTEKLAKHSWVIQDRKVRFVPNVGFVVGEHSTLVIDTGLGIPNGEIVLAEAIKLAPDNKLYLATTHFHPEHDLGAAAFPGATMIRSQAQQREIEAEGLRMSRLFQNSSPVLRELLDGQEYREADISFQGEYELDLGGVTVMIMAVGPAHTMGDTAFYVVEDKVLYAGDLMINALPSLLSDFSNIDQWITSLDHFEALETDVIVPSHRELVDAELIPTIRGYLTGLLDQTAAGNAQAGQLTGEYADWAKQMSSEMLEGRTQAARQAAENTLKVRPDIGPETN